MISTNDFKTGVTVEIDGDAWQVEKKTCPFPQPEGKDTFFI